MAFAENPLSPPSPEEPPSPEDPLSSSPPTSLPTAESIGESTPSSPETLHPTPIAICGIGLRLPGGIRSCSDYWSLLIDGRDARGPIPASRYNDKGFDNSLGGKDGIRPQQGYFLDEHLGALDSSFFSLTKGELERTDPQQRMLLEVVKECLDDAGEVDYRGRPVGCYLGTFGDDWLLMATKDLAMQGGGYSVTGAGDLMLANRVSYEYDLRGPSMAIKTGCSASLVALHEACRALQNGDASAAIVAGTSLIMTPTLTATMAAGELLSPESSCKTFDAAADGFARGEAITAVYIKPLEDALREGNPVRAVIRATATNADGRGQGLVTPNREAQEALMRHAYRSVGLNPKDTAYVECHGTGTPTGDPIETSAVGSVFGDSGVYIGSVKPNLGHSEGSSGLSSIIKCVMALENNIIPPNIKFNHPNPKIPFDQYKLVVPTVPTPLPQDRAERISVNSFGIGGTNAHAILESWNPSPGSLYAEPEANQSAVETTPELLLLSANTENALVSQISRHREYLQANPTKSRDVAHTLALRRQHLSHRSFSILHPNGEIAETASGSKIPGVPLPVIMVFSGQGAQWPEMGKEMILTNVAFRQDLNEMDEVLQNLSYPPKWKLTDELLKPASTSEIHKAFLAQPLCTALQIALVNAYSRLGVTPFSVVGHSSGEIAAAYAAGYLTMAEAITAAYYRGYVTTSQTLEGGMAAVGLGAGEVAQFLREGEVVVACENSPNSSTISGGRNKVLQVVAAIHESMPDTLARPLKVDMAYHSHHMTALAEDYARLLEESGFTPSPANSTAKFYSSVGATLIKPSTALGPAYWAQNLTSPVRFSAAMEALLMSLPPSAAPLLLEIGPHSTLAGPIRQILAPLSLPHTYISSFSRGKNTVHSFLSSVGNLFQSNIPLALTSLFSGGKAIPDLPTYPWDHTSSPLWSESRISQAWRHRQYPTHCLLGSRVPESSNTEPTWRHILRLEDEPWLGDHRIQSDVVFPFVGYVALAGEAVRQIAGGDMGCGYKARRMTVHAAMLVPTEGGVEVVTSLRQGRWSDDVESEWWDFAVSSLAIGSTTWTRHCEGRVKTSNKARKGAFKLEELPRRFEKGRMYDAMSKAGFAYGPAFRCLEGVTTSTTEELATGKVVLPTERELGSSRNAFTLHPVAMDACLQLLLAAKAKGLARSVVKLSVPTAIEELEVAQPVSEWLEAKARNESGQPDKPIVECQEEGRVVLRVQGLRLRPIADEANSTVDDVHAAARLHWMPDFDFVDHSTLFGPPSIDKNQLRTLEEFGLLIIIESSHQLQDLVPCQPHFTKFRNWLNAQVASAEAGTYPLVPHSASLCRLSSAERLTLIESHASHLQSLAHPVLAIGIKRIFDNLPSIFTGSVDTLATLLHDKLLVRIYDVINFDYAPFIHTLAHSRPQLRILEVGAGTGGTTDNILRSFMLDSCDLPSYSVYTFTDVSAGFFPAAQERFAYAPNLEFKVLDISRHPAEQGFEEGTYDLILAANVVHATPCLQETLSNLAWLAKENGVLVMAEVCNASRASSFIFGNFVGWWLGEDDGRVDGPCVGVERWGGELKSAGFNGVDSVVYDVDEEEYRRICVMVSRKKAAKAVEELKNVALLTSAPESEMCVGLSDVFGKEGREVSTFGLTDPAPGPDKDIIALLDLEGPFFENITPDDLAAFQRFLGEISVSQTLLWLTPPSQIVCTDPRAAPSIGVARTIRSELALRFAALELDALTPDLAALVSRVYNKACTAQDTNTLESDKEFVLHDGVVHIGRYRPFSLTGETARLGITDPSTSSAAGTTASLTIAKPGVLESLTWQTAPMPGVVPPGHVEVLVRNAGLNFRDVVYAGGLISWSGSGPVPLGMEIAGVVTRLGSGTEELSVGDRVMALTNGGLFATKAIVGLRHVVRMPTGLSFEQGATMQVVFATAIYALLDTGRLSPGMSVLIHSACGGAGLAALQVCKMVADVTVYCTVSNERKIDHLVQQFDIPRERIFGSRDDGFLEGVLRATGGQGVDLVFNSLAGELLHASWKCVARGGKMLELGKRDLSGSAKLDMSLFLDNRSYCGIDLAYLLVHRQHIVRDCIIRMLAFYDQGLVGPLEPIVEFDAANVKHAFRHLQAGEHIGKIIISMLEEVEALSTVPVAQAISFRPDATYLLVGGIGGLGRSLAVWLVERGARSLAFLSRSAGKTPESSHLARELESMGCVVTMVAGSINHIEDIKSAISASPYPITGVFQLAMVQRDSPFKTMSHADWTVAMEPKVVGTWNLHQALIDTRLDFFWLASSTVTVTDQPGQGNYKAGCIFLEAFCRYRHSLGLPASVLSICPIDNVGFVAENAFARRNAISQGNYLLGEREFLDSVEASLLSQQPGNNDVTDAARGWQNRGHIIMGLRSSSEFHLDDDRNTTNWRRDRRMGFYHNKKAASVSHSEAESSSLKAFIARLGERDAGAADILEDEETVGFLAVETGRKVLDFLLKPDAALGIDLSLSQIGLDSLTAIELRRWFRQAMGLQITVLELMGSANLKALGRMIAERLKEKYVAS
ncbi:KR domain-protein [Podospora aff. communis PSN243]|uniref:KR domain-protein n=1 Tax=Podospora aff. communis PSN243 TaxID=3040156 RepID=A0AAV9G5R8_9PEZI|nr:KR domain-protein [Podospora aff. communis PSN243]